MKEGERYAVRVSNAVATVALDNEEPQIEESLVLCKCMKSHTTAQENSPKKSEDLWEVL